MFRFKAHCPHVAQCSKLFNQIRIVRNKMMFRSEFLIRKKTFEGPSMFSYLCSKVINTSVTYNWRKAQFPNVFKIHQKVPCRVISRHFAANENRQQTQKRPVLRRITTDCPTSSEGIRNALWLVNRITKFVRKCLNDII